MKHDGSSTAAGLLLPDVFSVYALKNKLLPLRDSKGESAAFSASKFLFGISTFLKRTSAMELMGKCLHGELNDGVLLSLKCSFIHMTFLKWQKYTNSVLE